MSPFIDLPKAATLPYTYKTLQTSLGPSSVGEAGSQPKTKYVVSASGHAAHPDEIISSCQALQAHIQKQKDEAAELLMKWENGIRERELAEKRRVAPGWLDRDEKILQPTRTDDQAAQDRKAQSNIMDSLETGPNGKGLIEQREDEGHELDRAFGGMGLK